MFKYNGKIWNPKNPEKKLKQLGITWNDVEIINEPIKQKEEVEYENPDRLFYFINRNNKTSITSIYPDLNNLSSYININDYERCTKETIENIRSKIRQV